MSIDLYNLPFGPLTLEAHDRLSRTDLDASQIELQRIAVARGVEFGSAARREFTERIEQRKREIAQVAVSRMGVTNPSELESGSL